LRDAWTITARTGGIAPIVHEDGKPYGLIDGFSLYRYLNQLVGRHLNRQDLTISEILDEPCKEACDTDVPHFLHSIRIRDVLNRILREEHNDFLVVDEEGRYIGVSRQRDVLNPPRLRLILVDHNEPGQALGALEEAELVEILDHHRLGNASTHIPIRFTVDIVGSTSTLVSERTEDAGLSAPPAGGYAAGRFALRYFDPDLSDDNGARPARRRTPGTLGFCGQRSPGWRERAEFWTASFERWFWTADAPAEGDC
jgi:manganese-dependent inorganic pyrophosphatase